ncbi:hypothetical protein BQ8794_50751 [Mesorhizobium prunaredense]|uniref:Uncharacterized protein n=1 Tax=Mesorhizobium prunaredense TaxID=1631249 RepID=A0A1R3VFG4_9HYPH|nr:caspase family protein [Mesorhizobium prunaredense]SIT58649.1 hypothetical protein BQ8794_50751 [Mesorhizobium prunaredense]
MIDDSEILRRYFIAIATDVYEANGTFAALDVDQEVASIRGWLTDQALGARRFDAEEYAALAHRPSLDQIKHSILKQRRFTDGDAVVVYVTGHGITATDNGHFIVLHDTDPLDLADALRTADLIRWLAAHQGLTQAMIIIDVCQAGQLADNLPAVLTRDLPEGWFVILSAHAGVDAKLGAFSGAVAEFVEHLRHSTDAVARADEYLEPYRFIKPVVNYLRDHDLQKPLILTQPYQPSVCLPNPGYEPGGLEQVVTDPARRDLAILKQDMTTHWAVRAPVLAGVGPVFTGRTVVMQELIDAATGPPGTFVVSGRAGSGKSSVLARLVTCSDPGFRADHADVLAIATPVPPEGAVDIAVLATGKTSEQIAQQIGRVLGVQGPRPEATTAAKGWVDNIRAVIAGRDRPLTLVVDALDEASDPSAVLSTVLERLNPRGHPSLRLLLGVRSSGGEQTDEPARELASVTIGLLGARQIRIDADDWWDPGDLRAYVGQVLAQPGSPYGPAQIPSVAAAVESEAGRSYLVAGLTARTLAESTEALAAGDPRLDVVLAQGSAQLVANDLRTSLHDARDRRRASILLRACALANGRGVPVRIWPLLASAIAPNSSYGDSDVAWLLGHRLSGYLVRDIEDGLTVYRPFHDELRRVLAEGAPLDSDGTAGVMDQAEAQRRIALTLLPLATWGAG